MNGGVSDGASLRILMVAPNFPPAIGGAQRWAGEVARHLHEAGHNVEVIAPVKPGWKAVDAALPFTVRRCRVWGDAMAFSAVGAIRRACRDFKPSVILAGHWSGASAALRTTRGRIPVVCAIHGREIGLRPLSRFPPAQWIYDAVRRHAFRRSSSFICVSNHNRRMMMEAGVDPARLQVVPNGVDPTRFATPAPRHLYQRMGLSDRYILLTVARLVPLKGVDVVIEALPLVLQAQPNLAYVVVGDGADRKRLETIADREGVRDNVHFLGNLSMDDPDLVDAYQTCDLFIMTPRAKPPLAEGFGIVFLEAAVCGKPVVGSWTGGVPDAVENGRTGLLADSLDKTSIAYAVMRIAENDQLASFLGNQGRASVLRDRTWSSVARSIAYRLAQHCQDHSTTRQS